MLSRPQTAWHLSREMRFSLWDTFCCLRYVTCHSNNNCFKFKSIHLGVTLGGKLCLYYKCFPWGHTLIRQIAVFVSGREFFVLQPNNNSVVCTNCDKIRFCRKCGLWSFQISGYTATYLIVLPLIGNYTVEIFYWYDIKRLPVCPTDGEFPGIEWS